MEQFGTGVRFHAFFPPRQKEVRDDYKIIEANFDPLEDSPWEIVVSPVPRPIREDIRVVLLPALSAEVRAWLVAKRTDSWRSTYHAFRGRFDAASKQLLFHEHNAA
jgi:hypothetical protein